MDVDWDKVEKDITTFGIKVYPLEECAIEYCIGNGSAMEVLKGQCIINMVPKDVAFKRHRELKKLRLKQRDVNRILEDFQHEIELMKRHQNHTNVVQIYGITLEERKPVLIVELCHQTVDRYLLKKAESGTPATWHEKIKLCVDIARGLRSLHEAGIIHGDIKGENILVITKDTDIPTAKISDFGYSSTLTSSKKNIGRTVIFMAPESRGIQELEPWAKKQTLDIFSFGLVTYQIANDGKRPYRDVEYENVDEISKADRTNRHTKKLLASLPSGVPKEFRTIITGTTKYMPTERTSLDIVEQILYSFQDMPPQLLNTIPSTKQLLNSDTATSLNNLASLYDNQDNYAHSSQGGPAILMDQVAPLKTSENAWRPTIGSSANPIVPTELGVELVPIEVIIKVVKSLLNKLTLEMFDKISDQIIIFGNQSIHESDGQTLRTVVQLVFEKATDEASWPAMCAQLARKMLDKVSTEIKDDNVMDTAGNHIKGSSLFRKYLLNRCQNEFEKGWKVDVPKVDGEVELYSDEYYTAMAARRKGLGLIRFIGELFKLQMLTERSMHECIKKLLSNVNDPEEEETESLCVLMKTVGKDLDHKKAQGWMDIYFDRMKELSENKKLSSRVRFMIEEVIDLRKKHWIPRRDNNAPKKLQEIKDDLIKAEREKEIEEKSAITPPLGNNMFNMLDRHSDWDKKEPTAPTERPKLVLLPRGATTPYAKSRFVLNSSVKSPMGMTPVVKKDPKEEIDMTLQKFWSVQNIPLLVYCVKKLDAEFHNQLITALINSAVEKKQSDVNLICEAFKRFNAEEVVSKEALKKSCREFVEIVDDLSVDVPQVFKYGGQILVAARIEPSELQELLEPLIEISGMSASTLTAEYLKSLRNSEGEEAAVSKFKESGFDLKVVLAENNEDIATFLEKQELIAFM